MSSHCPDRQNEVAVTPSTARHRTNIIAAICTPLNVDQSLHVEALEMHIDDQARAGFRGLLVGGTMGLMQLLADETYRQLVRQAVRIAAGRFEVLVGVGDASFARTRERVAFVQQLDIDGVVVITPSFLKFNRAELLQYYRLIAGFSKKPVYLYDLPSVTGVKLDFDLVLELADHPNIAGIKCSVPWEWTRQLVDVAPARLRVIPAQPYLLDQLIRLGVRDNLDGIYGLVPELTAAIVVAAEREAWAEAARLQAELADFGRLLAPYGLFPAATAILNARGIPGSVAPAPIQPLTDARRVQLLAEPALTRQLDRARRAPDRPSQCASAPDACAGQPPIAVVD